MIGFRKAMKIDYTATLIASLNIAVFVLNLPKKSVLFHLKHKMIGFLNGMKIDYSVILTASLIKAFFILNLSKKQRLVPLKT
jgi:hypothetical protein